jgi:hypothetical protein
MNKMKELIKEWDEASAAEPKVKTVPVQLTARDYARIRALAEIFPARNQEQLISELLAAALDELEEAFPYVPSHKVIAEDEFGDPIYADAGLLNKYEELTKKFAAIRK